MPAQQSQRTHGTLRASRPDRARHHHAPAHFHAEYSGQEALVTIETLEVLRGRLPRRALALVLEWAAVHRDELRADWERARSGQRLTPIPPLE